MRLYHIFRSTTMAFQFLNTEYLLQMTCFDPVENDFYMKMHFFSHEAYRKGIIFVCRSSSSNLTLLFYSYINVFPFLI